MDSRAEEALKKYFPKFTHSLRDFQRDAINQIFEKGSSVVIMPTGGGKSLIYWVAGKGLGGMTLVISPLIALIEEQSEKLEQQGLETLKLHGGLEYKQQIEQMTLLYEGKSSPDFIFASPEKIATDGYFEFCLQKRKEDIKLVVIDEIHCVSQWGYDFRPFYKRIPDFLNNLFGKNWPTVLGLTATVNPHELNEIIQDFNIPYTQILKSSERLRFDIELKVEKHSNEEEKEARLWGLLHHHRQEKVIVYLYRKYHKRGVDKLAEIARDKGFKSLSFHGDLSGDERAELIKKFRSGDVQVLFATNAFGMGIDIPDIRVVIHFMIPESVEQYYQEIGRAGRDGNGGLAYILYSNKNIEVRRRHFIDKSFPKPEKIQQIHKKITGDETGLKTLQYFMDEEIQEALPYFLNQKVLEVKAKGFTKVNIFKEVLNNEVQDLINTTKTGMVIPVIRKTGRTPEDLFSLFFSAIAQREGTVSKMDKCFLINCKQSSLSKENLDFISREIEEKKDYKHELLDYLTYILDSYEDSKKLHQEIGRYLGISKHLLGKIYKTRRGDWVRSKSEVIIANLLLQEAVDYTYEEKLFYTDKNWIEPDFTFTLEGKKWYWEHLGMLGDTTYNEDWSKKKKIYSQLGIKTLVTTEERSNLSTIVLNKLQELKNGVI